MPSTSAWSGPAHCHNKYVHSTLPEFQEYRHHWLFKPYIRTLYSVGRFQARYGDPLYSNSRGKALERTIAHLNLITLNDGSATHLSTHNTLTHVDISLISPQLAHLCDWSIASNLYGSDHFPITTLVSIRFSADKSPPLPKYKTDLANGEF